MFAKKSVAKPNTTHTPTHSHTPETVPPITESVVAQTTKLSQPTILHLQRTIGNQAVQRMVKQQPIQPAPVPIRLRSLLHRTPIQRVELAVPSLEDTHGAQKGKIDSSQLAQMKYQELTSTQLGELWQALDLALKELNYVPDKKSKEEPPEGWLELSKAYKSVEFFLSKHITQTFEVALNKMGQLAAIGEFYLVENKKYSREDLARELNVSVEALEKVPYGRYAQASLLLDQLNEVNKENTKFTKRMGFPSQLFGEKAKEFEENFEKDYDKDFFKVLQKFRQNNNTAPNIKFAGGEGQIYLSDANPNICLKRWYKTRIKDKPKSIELLQEAYSIINKDSDLNQLIDVVKIYEIGDDWMIRDFDLQTINLKAANKSDETAKIVIEKAKKLMAEKKVLPNLWKKLDSLSDNMHWSKERGKILVIDMM
jgi:transcriptional regulator with XRE-family HTH domain